MARCLSGVRPKRDANHLRLSTLSRRRRVCDASGSEARMNCTFADGGIEGRSVLA